MRVSGEAAPAARGPSEKQLYAYVERCRRRFGLVSRLRIAAVGAATVAGCLLALAVAVAHLVPRDGWVTAARVALYVVAVATVVAVALGRVRLRGAARRMERRLPTFDGRISTWLDARARATPPALLPRLVDDTLRVSRGHPPHRVVPAWRLAPPVALILGAAALFGWMYAAAPQSVRLPAERLLLGDALGDTRPRIVVSPGDTVVRRGADVLVSARARGFAADGLRLHVSFAGSDRWEQAQMPPAAADGDGGREFVLVSVTEPVRYFVAGGGVNSPRYRVRVADLPVVERLDVALRFPAWTGLDPRAQAHGDVSGVAGTEVRVRVHGNRPLAGGRLVVDGEARALNDTGTGGFAIAAAGTWHVAVEHLGEVVRISDNFLIDVVEDQRPQVEFEFPGRDRSATAIEEVALRFRARDDFRVEAMTLRYAVNGGKWREQAGATSGGLEAAADHLVAFETLTDDDGRAMRPGDVLSFYAEAKDHGATARTALYFVDVRPFDRRYRERQGAGGGDGAGTGGLELSARQRDIVTGTWNLIRDRDRGADQDFRDQLRMVTALQRALQQQVETLVARAEGRRLSEEEDVESFVAELTAAAEQMALAAATLSTDDLEGALPAEQSALQHLLSAEASLTDIDVSRSRNAANSGSSASRSLAELVDLELDQERNRFETPQQPTFGERAQSDDGEWRRLTELARRQEALARRQERAGQTLPESRWQLERLDDELESLRERLAQGSEQQTRRQSSRGATTGSAASTRMDDAGERHEQDLRSALARIEDARASVQRVRNDQRAAATALRQAAAALRAGAERLRHGAARQVAERMRNAERAADELLADQERILERLRTLRNLRLREAQTSGGLRFRDDAMQDAARTKRRMQDDLGALAAQLAQARRQLEDAVPAASEQIDNALAELAESRLAERLATAAEYFEAGRPLFLVGHEEGVRETLAALVRRVGQAAEELASNSAAPGAPTVDDVRELRARLQAAATGDGGVLGNLLRDIARLEAAVFDGSGAADPQVRERAAAGAAGYRGLGADAANRARLVTMTLARLDQIEIALGQVEDVPVQAGRPRDSAYDSQQVARYFRLLSCGDGDGC